MARVLFTVVVVFATGTLSLGSAESQEPSCQSCSGKQITHTIGTVVFCVPRGLKVTREAGFEGAIRDAIALSTGEKASLTIYSNLSPSGYRRPFGTPSWFPADTAGSSSVRDRQCSEGAARDIRLIRNERYWRMISFPLGYAEYVDVSAKEAARFDRVLDSLCCRPLARSRR